MQASVIGIYPLHDIKYLLKFFWGDGTDLQFEVRHKGEKYFLRNTSRMQNIEFVG